MPDSLPGSKLYDDCLEKGLIRNEERYAEKLDRGYYISNSRDLICNLTNFSDEELVYSKNLFEQTIWNNYRRIKNKPFRRIESALLGIEREIFKFSIRYSIPNAKRHYSDLIRDMLKRAYHESKKIPPRKLHFNPLDEI